ncbi:MAG: hypothetical protein A3F70_05720 [Acidobacteria bacterium RIFCSPLOWO2_12_FULL_67_14]|nr:MAG: hypothetical protein A3F70_05720 [Acidobacteria bacterium RIFCSPLOWO2_12_FULL_67_14]
MIPQASFVSRLRRHRERGGISLDEIAAVTRIKPELLEAFERNDLSDWPRGLYARAWVRAYASMAGLDPIDTVDEFCRLFPHGDRRAGATLQQMAAVVAHPSGYRDEFTHGPDRRRTAAPRVNVLPAPSWPGLIARSAQVLWWRMVIALRTPAAQRLKRSHRASS